jgi:hypothetical protein
LRRLRCFTEDFPLGFEPIIQLGTAPLLMDFVRSSPDPLLQLQMTLRNLTALGTTCHGFIFSLTPAVRSDFVHA